MPGAIKGLLDYCEEPDSITTGPHFWNLDAQFSSPFVTCLLSCHHSSKADLHVMVVVVAAFNHVEGTSRDSWRQYAHMNILQPGGLATWHTLGRPND